MGLRTQKRRRREQKTDYQLRRRLLVSGVPRIVVRLTNRYVIVQAVESIEAQDKVIGGATSKDLLAQGWDVAFTGSLKSLPACYLTGLLLAKKLGGKGNFIVDVGMARTLAGGRIFAVVKGLRDGGLQVPASEEIFPSEERLSGAHLRDDVRNVIAKIKGGLS